MSICKCFTLHKLYDIIILTVNYLLNMCTYKSKYWFRAYAITKPCRWGSYPDRSCYIVSVCEYIHVCNTN